MKLHFPFWFLISYWIFLTRVLLSTAPWELISKRLAENPPLDLAFEPTSWLVHFLAYSVLGFLIALFSKTRTKVYGLLMAAAFIHGALCEYLQSFVPGRWPNAWDIVANSLGLTFVLGYVLLRQKNPPAHSAPVISKTSQEKQAA